MGVLIRLILVFAVIPVSQAVAQTRPAAAQNRIEIKEWRVPWAQTRPRDPDFVSSDSVWFVGQTGHYLARLNPQTGKFRKTDLPDEAGPHNLIVGRDGIVWYAGNLKGYIGRFDPKTGAIRQIRMPNPAAKDPHTLTFDGDEKNIWFTVQGGNFIGRLNIDNEKVDLIAVVTANASPYGIVVAEDGTPWVALFGTNKLASINPRTLALKEHPLRRKEARPRRLGGTSDRRIWYVDFAQGFLGALTPANGAIQEWRIPGESGSRPYGMAIDARDRIWVVDVSTQPNRFIGFDPGTEQFFGITPVPSGAGAIRHMDYDPQAGRIWFGTDANTIGYAQVN